MSIYIRGVDLPSDEWLDIRVRADGPSEVATKEHPYWKEIEVVQVSGSPTGIDSISKHLLMEKLQKATTNSIDPMFAKGLLEAQRLVMNMPIGSNLSEFPTGSDLISRQRGDSDESLQGFNRRKIWKTDGRRVCRNTKESDRLMATIPQWIPVSERLPEEHVKVLMFGHEALNDEDVYAVKQLDVDVFRPVAAPSVRWLAWMPLPPVYKGGEKE